MTKIAQTGYLKYVCFDEIKQQQYFKCMNSDVYYRADFDRYYSVSQVCSQDSFSYQACGFGKEVSSGTDHVLCGGYICEQRKIFGRFGGEEWKKFWWGYEYIGCSGKDCKTDKRDCSRNLEVAKPSLLCDDKCDAKYRCVDESYCNGYQYGLSCENSKKEKITLSVDDVCDEVDDCSDGSDEKDCVVTDSTLHTCTHYSLFRARYGEDPIDKIVPIHNYTRCSVFNTTGNDDPYCWDYLDQTNCSDIERVGGYCEVNGFMASVSKYMVCYDVEPETDRSIKLCDDDSQNNCISPSIKFNDCRLHKHRLCDRVTNCVDNGDEESDICQVMTKEFMCKRRFLPKSNEMSLPVSWIMDGEIDCMNGEDEESSFWRFCRGEFERVQLPGQICQNVYKCPQGDGKFAQFDQLCDGVESCGNGGENTICGIARDFPDFPTVAPSNGNLRNSCKSSFHTCETREFKRPWGDVSGEPKIEISVPTSKVNCNEYFGEQYLYLSCMGLCEGEHVKCPLDDENRKLVYNSCPGQ